jgi:Zn-dependent protease with chaperone function
MQEFDARRYQVGAADGKSVKIGIDSGLLHIKDDGGPAEYLPLSDIDMKMGGENGKRVIFSSKSSGETIFTENLKILDELESAANAHDQRLAAQLSAARKEIRQGPWREAKWWVVTGGLLAAVAVSVFAGVDLAVTIAEKHIPPSIEQQLGKVSIESERSKKLEQKSAEYKRVKFIADKLLKHYKDNPYSFNFYIQPSAEINAYALPGGNVVVNERLVKEAEADDELAGVLAHEIGHVKNRHSLKAALRSAGVWVCIAFIMGAPSQDQLNLIGAMINLEDLQFSRHQETEADEVSVELTSAAGYKPDGIISFFKKVEKEDPLSDGKALSMLSTHPMPAERIEHIKNLIEQRTKRPPQ